MLQKSLTTLLPNTHPDRHFFLAPRLYLQDPNSQPPARVSRLSCSLSALVRTRLIEQPGSRGLRPISFWGGGKSRPPPRTMETGQQQSNLSPTTDGSTKLETQCRVARTPQRWEFRTNTSQIFLCHWPLCQPRHCECATQRDLTRRDRNSNSVVQIPPLTEHPPTKGPQVQKHG